MTTSTTRGITVNDTPVITDLLITTLIADGSTASSALTKGGAGRLTLSPMAPSTFSGTTTIAGGVLDLTDPSALGGLVNGTGATTVVNGGTLMLTNITILNRPMQLTGAGVSSEGSGAIGSLRSVGGGSSGWSNDTTSGAIALLGATTIGTDNGSTLTITGGISGAFAISKILPGTLVYAGNTGNNYTGATTVNEGTLQLNKSGSDAIGPGATLTIGNDAGGQINVGGLNENADQVIFEGNNQLDTTSLVSILSSGLLNLNGFSQTLTAAANVLSMEDSIDTSAVWRSAAARSAWAADRMPATSTLRTAPGYSPSLRRAQ